MLRARGAAVLRPYSELQLGREVVGNIGGLECVHWSRVRPMKMSIHPASRLLAHRLLVLQVILTYTALLLAVPAQSKAADNTFEKTLTVSGPVRIELSNGSGSVEIKGSVDGKVHIRGRVSGGWSLFGNSEKSVTDVVANPPIEQQDSVVRIGKNLSWTRNVSIDYEIETPHDTELDASVASGGITVDNLKGPAKVSSASGYVHVYRIERDVTLNAASGAIDCSKVGGFLKISTASGDISAADVRGEVRASAASGSIRLSQPGDRVDISSASGSIDVTGAKNDLKVHAISGSIHVEGDPSANRLWEVKTVSGSVEMRVPPNASFVLTAEATSGDIRTNIPVILEEQGKHSLRAHVGSSSGRIEVHTVSGGVNVNGA
jgi:hypothetical protein